ncbi:gamma-glutamylcyclotransferase family protein [Spongiibacter marinus]|uniref:gamma-glutamylcyclotransferase family protein n=1 Tax=Spongiibacter marinus TaxID=354246 RepID=UPI003569DC12
MHYFAYGSNMSLSRLRGRVPSAEALGCFTLNHHDLRFHKASKDGSGKCDAFFTSDPESVMYGVLFKIDPAEKSALDKAEGLGYGYEKKEVTVSSPDGTSVAATTYIATKIDKKLKPYSWYVNHVLVGANEASLPQDYIDSKIISVEAVEDSDKERDAKQRAIHS